MESFVANTLSALRKNKIDASYFASATEAVTELLNQIGVTETVGIGGSITIKELGIPEKLLERGNKLSYHWLETSPEKKSAARHNSLQADVYLCSTNALTEQGQLINIDGTGNRVAAMIYGPPRVFILCGINKIAPSLEAAMQRIKEHAYLNSQRLKLNTPCAATGKCNDCDSPQRMCNVTTIIEKKPNETDLKVFLIAENLGF